MSIQVPSPEIFGPEIAAGSLCSAWDPYYSGVEGSRHPSWLLTGLPTPWYDDDGDVRGLTPHIPTNSASFPPPSLASVPARAPSLLPIHPLAGESCTTLSPPPPPLLCLLALLSSSHSAKKKFEKK